MRNKQYLQEHLIELYDLPKDTKIVLFKNPFKYKIGFIENVNPNHRRIIYGRKWNNKGNYEKIARIIIPSLLISEILTLTIVLTFNNFSLFTGCLFVGFYTSSIYKLFNFNSIYKLFNGVDFYQQIRKYNNRYLWT
jgi:hypothetical protein